MRRTGANTTLAFVLASLSLHGAAGVGLLVSPAHRAQAVIAERPSPAPPVELSFEPAATPPPSTDERGDAGASPVVAPEPERERERRAREEREREIERREDERRERERERFTVPTMLQTAPAPPPPPPPPPPPMHQQAVEQSQSNNQRADDARYIAERDNNVQVETRAPVRGTQQDNANPQHAATAQRAPGQGAGVEDVHDGRRNRQGADTSQEATHVGGRTSAQSTQQGSNNATTSASAAAQAGGRAAGAAGAATESIAANRVFAASEGVWGQYALRPERSTAQAGANGANGAGGSGGSSAAARVGVAGQGAAGAVAALSPASTDYARAFGGAAEQERREARERRTQARGESPTQSWQQLREGMENYVESVRVGNQTALRTRASPFATYLSQMHHRIHRLFADGFLASLDASGSENPLNDPRLMNTVEIVLERDGRVSRIGIVRTSGNTMFDVAAMNSVRRSAPFGNAPEAIRSADGKVYIHWGFYRSERQCGTFNAEPFILSAPNNSGSRERTTIIAPSVGRDR
ncbi:MAG: TonB family protein [Polyangiales bacterium]